MTPGRPRGRGPQSPDRSGPRPGSGLLADITGPLRGRAAAEAAADAIGRPLLAPRELDPVLAGIRQGMPHRPLAQPRVLSALDDPAASTVYVLDGWSLLVTDAAGRTAYAQARLAGTGTRGRAAKLPPLDVTPWSRQLTGAGQAGVEALAELWQHALVEQPHALIDVRIIPVLPPAGGVGDRRLVALRVDWAVAGGALVTALFANSPTDPPAVPAATVARSPAPSIHSLAPYPLTPNPLAPSVHPLAMQIAELVVGAARGRWQRLRFTLSAVGPSTAATLVAESPGPAPARAVLDPPTAALLLARQLRAVTAAPDRGAWFTCTVTVATEPAVAVSYDHDSRPQLVPEPDRRTYLDDRDRFPRDLNHTPSWLRGQLADAPAPVSPHRRSWRGGSARALGLTAVLAALAVLAVLAVLVGPAQVIPG